MFSFTLTLQHVDRLTGKVFCSAVNSEHPDSDHQQWLPLPRRGLVPAVHHAVVMIDNWLFAQNHVWTTAKVIDGSTQACVLPVSGQSQSQGRLCSKPQGEPSPLL